MALLLDETCVAYLENPDTFVAYQLGNVGLIQCGSHRFHVEPKRLRAAFTVKHNITMVRERLFPEHAQLRMMGDENVQLRSRRYDLAA